MLALTTTTVKRPTTFVKKAVAADPTAFATPKHIIAYPMFEIPQPQATKAEVKSALMKA